MSEKLHVSHEHIKPVENHAESLAKLEQLQQAASKAEHGPASNIEKIRDAALKEAVSGKDVAVGEQSKNEGSSKTHVTRYAKKIAYERTLHRAQAHLSQRERAFSRIIHRPWVEQTSAIGAKTVARSYGLASASIISLIGTVLMLFISRRYGIGFSYFGLIGLFVVGYLLGLVFEFFVKLITVRRNGHGRYS
jgi:hypothetical protein